MLYEDFKIEPEDWYDLYKKYTSSKKSVHKGVILENWKPIKTFQAKKKYNRFSEAQDAVRFYKLLKRIDYEEYCRNHKELKLVSAELLSKEFGGWRNVVKSVFSNQELERFSFVKNVEKFDINKIVDTMVEYDIYTKDEYDNFKRQVKLDYMPNKKTLMKYYGKWSNIQRLIQGRNVKSIIERYLVLWENLGKKPSSQQCNKYGVEIKNGYAFFGSREKFLEATKYARRCFKEFIRRKNGTYKSNGRTKEQMAKIRAISLENRRKRKEGIL